MTPRKLIILGVAKLLLIAVAFGVVYSLYGCNTVQGVGRDIEKAGTTIERAGSR
ncbi:MAG: entericidin [Hydrogenophilales bacterium CG03_land_8_20_14_0_80_62_28]|nr:entericidin A/B family lipoprotein [Betaproteobacteria bacterium]PIV24182.1 MAG: entericidin [Hydrogenophilales bacterium CG03_land_8_20_14_0_80_62_28]PIW37570.1 MAG: entericidin [Hydrogenophilales bacterium CG15_BIG_FIL_POST_REV_8_21_14_020_62_31]PIW70917.1 MAG: entericidin [Hydrogenophilales bacterium CG12_big_fil_rev_8_21_14_0_65_61_21]PIX02019.1 MAG: entericidin [Hydrogenophilales bacterium CG_4_8_14_3_um_filter_62_83]PIY99026.1 MAG: entericidin [Hydrogenophilales bacterium CG_4_10_14_0